MKKFTMTKAEFQAELRQVLEARGCTWSGVFNDPRKFGKQRTKFWMISKKSKALAAAEAMCYNCAVIDTKGNSFAADASIYVSTNMSRYSGEESLVIKYTPMAAK